MRIVVYSAKPYDRQFLDAAARPGMRMQYCDARLSLETVALAEGAAAICAFVNDDLSRSVLEKLAEMGVRLIALRCAGFNQVDLAIAEKLGLTIARVPAYSPYAVAEHTMALILSLNRKIHRAYNRVREGNFALDGLLGFDLHGKTIGIVGTGKIGAIFARIAAGFGCRLVGHDLRPNPDCEALGMAYVTREELFQTSDIVALMCPLTPETRHLIRRETLPRLKKGVMLVNTSRGAIIDTQAAIAGLKDGTIGSLGIDVYEEEADLFFEDLSNDVLRDDVFARLLTFPNVLVTGHQGFFTQEALTNIADTTIGNIESFFRTGRALHAVSTEQFAGPA
ncbi:MULTISPECIES: 2-hydroxyacid dehydrogenase [unclassified Agrobacterium]|uniref:2-hydroxyacid dehydrogenase n=1 Tax=unclassified Agrobacterium TaxID=2632611 RepID=UPI0003654C65|nr:MULTISPECIES: 2-hydroxyacid dehydrogenase [unclassified Agrobacterium]SNB83159.1 D-lactate dehydrogenase [Agrobacterium sp. 719_389]